MFAVPGEITSRSRTGTNALLRLGATPLTAAADVLERFGLETAAAGGRRRRAPAALLAHLPATAPTSSSRARARRRRGCAALLAELELAGLVVEARRRVPVGCCEVASPTWAPYWLADRRPPLPERAPVGAAGRRRRRRRHHRAAPARSRSLKDGRARAPRGARGRGGASGRNGGFALRGGAMRVRRGARVARARAGAAALAAGPRARSTDLAELAGDALRRPGSLRLAADEEERDEIREEFDALHEDGFAAEWLEGDELEPPLPGGSRRDLPPGRRGDPACRWRRRRLAAPPPRRAPSSASTAASTIARRAAMRSRSSSRPTATRAGCSGRSRARSSRRAGRWSRPSRSRSACSTSRTTRATASTTGSSSPTGARRGRVPRLRLDVRADRRGGDDAGDPGGAGAFIADLLGRQPQITHRWAGIFGLVAGPAPARRARPRTRRRLGRRPATRATATCSASLRAASSRARSSASRPAARAVRPAPARSRPV